jgi:hypothetical protein
VSIIRELLDVTPLPPEDADADALTLEFSAMSARRQALIESIAPPLAVTSPEDRAFLDELRARQAAWMDALSRALDHVRQQRIGTTNLKHYAASLG